LQGKGYPDLATRQFLRTAIDSSTFHGPILGLFDYDPYGIDILKCYRVGSKASAKLAIPEMKWIGIKSQDVGDGAMALSQADRVRAHNLLEVMLAKGDVGSKLAECVSELQRMLMLNVKAEIQILDNDARVMMSWLEDKMTDELMWSPTDMVFEADEMMLL
jgi:meiotic recombination protein SPO11